ncbi:MAG: NAD(P)H-hydrate dehydratase [Selenomonadaceae bacterium]|nr:NAD(P)H-hydrate dehydratase [Selenomonadaceae bacterium]
MKIALAKQMREIDKKSIEEFGISELVLMENAGRKTAEAVCHVIEAISKKSICILAGSGNNGGDALVAARYLSNLGARIKIFLIGNKAHRTESLIVQMKTLRGMGIELQSLETDRAWERLQVTLRFSDVIVDGILGTGFSGQLRPSVLRLVRLVNSTNKPVISIDLPSGVESDSGQVGETAINATCTVALGLPKFGHYICPGASYVGELLIDDIGIPSQLLINDLHQTLINDELAITLLPNRPKESHKGSVGKILIIAGSRGMTGAASLASMSALKTGAGLVTLAVAESLNSIFEVKLTEVMTVPLPEVKSGIIGGEKAVSQILNLVEKVDAILIGPGLGREKETIDLVQRIVEVVDKQLILDADALFAFNGNVEALKNCKQIPILTPHLGELATLLNTTVEELRNNLVETIRQAAQNFRAILVAKFESTIVAYPNGEIFISSLGNEGMATGGCGDVLAGAIAGLIKQTPFAPIAGVYLHGTAGDLAFAENSDGLIASDVMNNLPVAIKNLRALQK